MEMPEQVGLEGAKASSLRVESWRIWAASVRGASHEKAGIPCQDAHEKATLGDWLVAAVADGAGSATFAEDGARIAVKTAVSAALSRLAQNGQCDPARATAMNASDWEATAREIVKASLDAVAAEARERARPLADFASTLLVCISGPERTVIAQVGDGAVVAKTREGNIETLTRPPHSEYINETIFLVSEGAPDAAQIVVRDDSVRSVAMMTDGLQLLALKYPTWEPFAPFFQTLFAFLRDDKTDGEACAELATLLTSDRVRARSDDDITLLLAVRRSDLAESSAAGGNAS